MTIWCFQLVYGINMSIVLTIYFSFVFPESEGQSTLSTHRDCIYILHNKVTCFNNSKLCSNGWSSATGGDQQYQSPRKGWNICQAGLRALAAINGQVRTQSL